jgi:hypothetical protein
VHVCCATGPVVHIAGLVVHIAGLVVHIAGLVVHIAGLLGALGKWWCGGPGRAR